MTKKILLTGTGGFIGGNLKTFLPGRGFDVFCAPSKNYDFTQKETVENLLLQANPDILILSGFYGIDHPSNPPADIEEVNLKIFNNFFNLAKDKTIITFGSGAEFGKTNPVKKAKEGDLGKTIPQDLYGKTKYLISKEIEKYNNVYNLRIFGLYGHGEQDRRFITHAIKENLQNKPITIKQDTVFSYLYIKDFLQIILRFLNKAPQNRFINLVPGQSISLVEIANIINNISTFKSAVIADKEGLANEYTGSNETLLKELNGFNFTSYQEGIKDFFNYLKGKNEVY